MIRDDLAAALRHALEACGVRAPDRIDLERPARREHGDWSSNVVLSVARPSGRNPRELALEVVDHLEANLPFHVDSVAVAGGGFVNFFLAPSWLHQVLDLVVTQGTADYARHHVGNGTHVNIEFVSANPTGPVHAGHARGAAYGDSLARILERVGHEVSREFYINDRGVQMEAFAASLAARNRGDEPPEDGYQGQYIIDWAEQMPSDADPLEWGYAHALEDQLEVLGAFNVHFDTWFSERDMVATGAVESTLADLRAREVAYDQDGATWLRSTAFGDDKDRVLVKSDGELAYLLPDIAYHRDKFARADLLIDVWGADHHGHVPRIRAGLEALGHDPNEIEFVITQLVDLVDKGEPVKLSKRAGNVIELRDLLDIAGADATRLTYLLQSVDSRQTVDLSLVVSEGMDNPVYYVQMAHARIAGIARRAAESSVSRVPLAEAHLSLLTHERELDVLRSLSDLPSVVLLAAADRAPHKITTWVRELAGNFHGFYHDCFVIHPDVPPDLAQARLWLTEAARIGLAIGLDLLGVSAPDQL